METKGEKEMDFDTRSEILLPECDNNEEVDKKRGSCMVRPSEVTKKNGWTKSTLTRIGGA